MYCIYQVTNKINGKRYIGQHKYSNESNPMGKYKGSGKILKLAYKKYGIENFETEILYKRIRDKETIDAMEIWAIEKYKPEYNIAKGGNGGNLGEEVNKRISAACKGRTAWNKGKKCPWASEFNHRTKKGKPANNKGISTVFHSEESRMKCIQAGGRAVRGTKWFNNGIKNVRAIECPQGFKPGKMSRKEKK